MAFKDGVEDIPPSSGDAYDASPRIGHATGPAGGGAAPGIPPASAKPSKWQPLSAMEPSPITEHDPFSLGDSDDEPPHGNTTSVGKEAKETKPPGPAAGETAPAKKSDTKDDDDAERLRKAAAEAMSDSLVDDTKKEAAKP